MIEKTQGGFTLVEAAIAAAVVAVAAAGALFALSGYGRYAAHQSGPVHAAAMELAEQTLQSAQDAWKYGSPGSAPAGSALVPFPIAMHDSSLATATATVTAQTSNQSGTQAQITVTVTYTPDPGHPGDSGTVTVSGNAAVKAPLPGSRIADPDAIPQPSGAP